MNAWLETLPDGKRYDLAPVTLIGRGPTAALKLETAGVSREHATIKLQPDGWWLSDLRSANGTFLNGVPVAATVKLKDGDEIVMGPQRVRFRCGVVAGLEYDTGQMTLVSTPVTEVAEVTLLVADLQDYSRLAAEMSAAAMAQAVAEWCGECRAILTREGAHIDKFIGDCVFAWWRGRGDDQRRQALAAARALSAAYCPPAAERRVFSCGVGLHTGSAALSREGAGGQFTLLGAEVNLVFRIETLTRKTCEPIVVSAAFANGWKENAPAFRGLGDFEIKGWNLPVEIFGLG